MIDRINEIADWLEELMDKKKEMIPEANNCL